MEAGIFYVLVGAVAVAAFARWRGWPAPLLVTVVALAASFRNFLSRYFDAVGAEAEPDFLDSDPSVRAELSVASR